MEWFLDKFKKLGVESILDVGCGIGRHADKFKNYAYFGVDIARKYIDRAVKESKLPYSVIDVTKLELAFVPVALMLFCGMTRLSIL